MTKPKITDVVTAGFGASDGGQYRIHRWDLKAQKVRELGKGPIEWIDVNGLKVWDIAFLGKFVGTLLALLKPDQALKLYGWGADIAAIKRDGFAPYGVEIFAAPTYSSVMERENIRHFIDQFDSHQWHVNLGGACQKPWQPIA